MDTVAAYRFTPIRLQAYTFVVAASLSSTYCSVSLRQLLAAASVSILNANWYYTSENRYDWRLVFFL